jgi:hypothetical protein
VLKNTVRGVVLESADGESSVRLAPGSLTDSLKVFAGATIEIEVEGTRRRGVLSLTRIVSPTRRELSCTTRRVRTREGLGYSLEAANAIFRVVGGAPLLRGNRRVHVDAWTFEDGRAWVIAVEAKTTQDWTLLERKLWGRWVPSNVIRGQGRRVWILAREGARVQIRRGDKTGWVLAEDLEAGEPVVNSGLVGRVPE